jgi:hypothetical protein
MFMAIFYTQKIVLALNKMTSAQRHRIHFVPQSSNMKVCELDNFNCLDYTLVCWGCCLTVYIAFGGFALICFYPIVADPHLLPAHVDFMPACMAKLAGVLNPLFYLWSVFIGFKVFLNYFY